MAANSNGQPQQQHGSSPTPPVSTVDISRRASDSNSTNETNNRTLSTDPTDTTCPKRRMNLGRRRSSLLEGSDSDNPSPSTTANNPTISEEEQEKEDKRVCIIRGATIATLLTATVTVASLTYFFVRDGENKTFLGQYEDSVAKLAQIFQNGIDEKHHVAETFAAMYTSRYGNAAHDPPIWPNATMPDFEEQAEGQLKLGRARGISFSPIITQGVDRLPWEAYAKESAWGTEWPENRTVDFGIFTNDPVTHEVVYDPGYAPSSLFPGVLVPIWQITPIAENVKTVMLNLHSEEKPHRMRAIDDMLKNKVETLTAILQLEQDTELRPSSIMFYPVFDDFEPPVEDFRPWWIYGESATGWDRGNEPTSADEESMNHEDERELTANRNGNIVGTVGLIFSWDDALSRPLPEYIKGMICVLQTSIDQTYSYTISGDEVRFLGEGDLHDPKYDELGRSSMADLSLVNVAYGNVDNLITYTLTMYPSQEFEDQYVTSRAAIYTVGVVLIFVCTAGLFLLYDYLVENRQRKTATLARQTSTIVDSMFPAGFRERLYKRSAASPGLVKRKTSSMSNGPKNSGASRAANETTTRRQSIGTQKTQRASNVTKTLTGGYRPEIITLRQIDKFMKNINVRSSDNNIAAPEQCCVDEPIADLFLDTSIMFADIVGFTSWSSERSPIQVFRLLERLFWEFDNIATRLNVFKLGTIGDCYIAVTGIPDPINDHATLLTQFAFECRDKVREVCADLEAEGLDTSKLDMRFGIHSGAITAGILRGTKSRFELFGDTINTASRMESTGKAGKIQLSEETAELLRYDQMGKWLRKRPEKITAKGKGLLQTYWAENRPEEARMRVSFSDELDDLLTPESLETLIEYDEEKGEAFGLGTNVSRIELTGKDNEIEDSLDLFTQHIQNDSYESA